MTLLTLGIESSCDDTAIAVVRGQNILSNCIRAQEDLVAQYGGVFPEQASRRHLDVCEEVLERALGEASCSIQSIDLIAVTYGPGLIGSLLIGIHFAKGLAWSLHKPLIGVHHLKAHLYAACMKEMPLFPALGLLLSGGHTILLLMDSLRDYKVLGQTQDDAIGESFDKAARLLSLPYPGGGAVEQAAQGGDPHRYGFKPCHVKDHPFDFSFSGLKTALAQQLNQLGPLDTTLTSDLAASFQRAAFQTIEEKIQLACLKYQPRSIVLGGGVCQSQTLRAILTTSCSLPLYFPPPGLSVDNGAMIAGMGAYLYEHQITETSLIEAKPRLPL